MILGSGRSGLGVRGESGPVGGGLGGGSPGQNGAVGRVGGGLQGWGPDRWGPRRVGVQKGWGAEPRKSGARRVGGPKFRAFFPSPATIFTLFVSLGVFSWNFGGV